jgi:hypothetical protein
VKPIVPARILGGRILVEAAPISSGITNIHRGVEIGAGAEEIASGPRPGAASNGPYRAWQSAAAGPSGTPVIVREISEAALGMLEAREAFERTTIARSQLAETPAPRLLHALGREGRLLASVEEYVSGTPLSEVLRASGREMPVEIALAIGRGLVTLWTSATAQGIRLLVDAESVLLDTRGEVRVLPDYAEERARQAVGAAILILQAPIAYASPEEINGARMDARSPMFGLGLLLYEMLTGAHPVATEDGTMFQILSSIAQHDIPHLRTRRAGIHPSVNELIHRCLARDPRDRFDSWKELSRAYAGAQSLFRPTGAREIAAYLDEVIPRHPLRGLPAVADLDAWRSLPSAGYESVALRAAEPIQRSEPRWTTRLDRDAVYPTADARPMYAAGALLIDARPVTMAEFERFLLMTRRPRPTHLDSPSPANEEDACTFVSVEDAAAYARWAGKRIPTEEEWESAVMALGAGKLGVGEVWEWTITPHPDGGHVVRGGRWRDQASVPARLENRSFAVSPAADLGFRCVVDRSS